ncbi:MAG: hypothetical protein ABI919_02755 [Ramlibacter sp.]
MNTIALKTLPLAAFQLILCTALLAAVADADAKGGRRSGSSSKSHSSSDHDSSSGGSSGTTINLRSSGSTSSSSTSNSSSGIVPAAAAARGTATGTKPTWEPATPLSPEEEAKRAAAMTGYERDQAEKLAGQKAAAEKRETDRLAEEKAASQRALQKTNEERAAAARLAADEDRKRREAAAVNAEADQVLQRAKADYPVLKTAEGQAVLQQILEKQKALQARGLYPSVAMVEAVADHAHVLTPKANATPQAAPVAQAPKTIGGCRWVTPTQWGCS